MPQDLLNTFCKTIQSKVDAATIRNPNRLSPNDGVLPFLLSDTNRNAVGFSFDPYLADGKNKKGRVRFMHRGTLEDYYEAIARDVCTPGDTVGYLYDEFELAQTAQSRLFTFSWNEIRDFCEGKSEHIAEVITNYMRAYRSHLNRKVIDRLVDGGFIGNFANGVPAGQTLPLFKADGSTINPLGEVKIEDDVRDADINDGYGYIGAGLLGTYTKMKGIACCNGDGYNPNQLNVINGYMRDTYLQSKIGTANSFLVVRPGALQLVYRNRNVGEFVYEDRDHAHVTMADPVLPNMTYDMYMHVIKCNDDRDIVVNFQFDFDWDLWGYPDDLFKPSDELYGVKDVFQYVAECSDDNPCSYNSPPVAAFTYTDGTNGTATFDGSHTDGGGTVVEYVWNFGDDIGVVRGAPGATPTEDGVTGTYADPVVDFGGAVTDQPVTLYVIDDQGNASAIVLDLVTVTMI